MPKKGKVASSISFQFLLLLLLLSGCTAPAGHPKLVFHGSKGVSIPYEESPRSYGNLPVIQLSMNGVAGRFIVDTGSSGPMFTMTAVRQWHLSVSNATGSATLSDGRTARANLVKNVTLDVAPQITLHWNEVYVSPENNAPYFGLIDYHTLKGAHAVIDINTKTITITP
jgi:hypothetical protein